MNTLAESRLQVATLIGKNATTINALKTYSKLCAQLAVQSLLILHSCLKVEIVDTFCGCMKHVRLPGPMSSLSSIHQQRTKQRSASMKGKGRPDAAEAVRILGQEEFLKVENQFRAESVGPQMLFTSVCSARLRSSAPTQKWMSARRHTDFKSCRTLPKQDEIARQSQTSRHFRNLRL